jgi:hypothetical protein
MQEIFAIGNARRGDIDDDKTESAQLGFDATACIAVHLIFRWDQANTTAR